jgi:hypothetical protein
MKEGDTYPCGYRGNENMGKFWELNLKNLAPKSDCRRCDWECFRDPSELCAPVGVALYNPAKRNLNKGQPNNTLSI